MESYRISCGIGRGRVKLRIREFPDKSAKVIENMSQGQKFQMQRCEDPQHKDWMIVQLNDLQEGYCLLIEKGVVLLEKVEHMLSPVPEILSVSVEENIVIVETSPKSGTKSESSSGSDFMYFLNEDMREEASWPSSLRVDESLNENSRERVISYEALPGPAHGLYLNEFDANEQEDEYSSEESSNNINNHYYSTDWSGLEKINSIMFTLINAMGKTIGRLLEVMAVFLFICFMVFAISIVVLIMTWREYRTATMTLDAVRVAT